ncbi:DUF11 domain-containing protein [Paenibacillus protaetiae]|uniref:DUF11 domain-containing protein n=2 Tax=Paenibacillus protaetiae TaxID=2509456 RepID=A0A4P6ESJ7_9BACL|nr:DUF11 domain-containing protein [Paenibacillus protaetiae]
MVPSQPGTQVVSLLFTVPAGAILAAGTTFVRLRLTTDLLDQQNAANGEEDPRSIGPASDGEVEDYSLTISEAAVLIIDKEVAPSSAEPGEQVTYTFTVENPNAIDLTNVQIEDSLLGLIDSISVLPAGATITLSATYTIPPGTPAGSTIINTVVAESDQTPPANSSAHVTVLPLFTLAVSKLADRATALPGETVTYTLTVTNTSNDTITNVAVTDAMLGFSTTIGAMTPNETQFFTVNYTIPLGTPAGTVLTNVTTAVSDETGPVSDFATVVVSPAPSDTIVKTVSSAEAAPGDTVTYTITVTNAGNEAITNVHITDPALGVDVTLDQLDPGDSVSLSVPFTIPLTAVEGEQIVNVATVTTNETDPEQDIAIVTVTGVPALLILKSVSPSQAKPGAAVTYTFIVTNTGNTELSNVRLEDPLLGIRRRIGTLAAGESRTIDVPFTLPLDATDDLVNTVTAAGDFDEQTVTDDSQATLQVLLPGLELSKTVNKAAANPGETVFFTFTLTNTGEASLTNLVLSDPLLSYFQFIAELLPGSSITETLPFTVPAGSLAGTVFTNLITVTSTELGPQTAEAGVTVNDVPAITLSKSADRNHALPGETVSYTITVTNTGNLDLTNVTIRDALLGLDTVLPVLAVGASTSLVVNFVIPLDAVIGSVIRNLSIAFSDQTDTAEAVAKVVVDVAAPLLSIAKFANTASAASGETVIYTIIVTNQGTTGLTNVIVSDDTLGFAQLIGTLLPLESRTFNIPFIIPENTPNGSIIINTAIADSDQTDPVAGSAQVSVEAHPELLLVKSISPVTAAPGETVTAVIVATNAGNVTLTNIIIADETLHFRTVIPVLPVGESITIALPIVVPFVEAFTVITNTATASSSELGETSAAASYTVLPAFVIDLVKSVDRQEASPGETVTFTFVLRNLSNTPITNLHLADALLGLDQQVDILPIGFVIVISRSFQIPLDARGGTAIMNTAILTSAETQPVTASAQVAIRQVPRLELEKTVTPAIAYPGQRVFFRVSGTNTGNVPLFNIRYADHLLGPTGTVSVQDVGQQIELTLPLDIPENAVPGSEIVNTLLVNSEQTGTLSAAAAVKIIPLPLAVNKRSNVSLLFVEDTARFTITAANISNTILNDVIITDPLPEGTTFVPHSVIVGGRSVPSADPASGIAVGSLAPGQSTAVSFIIKQTAPAPDNVLRNRALVSFLVPGQPNRYTAPSNLLEIPVEDHEE